MKPKGPWFYLPYKAKLLRGDFRGCKQNSLFAGKILWILAFRYKFRKVMYSVKAWENFHRWLKLHKIYQSFSPWMFYHIRYVYLTWPKCCAWHCVTRLEMFSVQVAMWLLWEYLNELRPLKVWTVPTIQGRLLLKVQRSTNITFIIVKL